jgi:L-iditol 2-dehydrogenase
MKALILKEYNLFSWEDTDMPVYGNNEVLIKVEACAVCGSDVHGMTGSTGRRIPPIIMGHEAAGVIIKCGSDVSDYKVGDRVTFDSTVYCNKCDNCTKGLINLCDNREVLGVSCPDYRKHGAFAEYVAVPEYILYKLPDNVSFVQASMVEPLAVAYHAITRTAIPLNGSVAVIGVGTIGMLTVQVLKAFGVQSIIAIDIDNIKLEQSLKYGADHALNSKNSDIVNSIKALTAKDEGVDACYDATGLDVTVNLGLEVVKKGGDMVLIGNVSTKIDFPLQWVVTREISLYGSCASAGEYQKCHRLFSQRG